MIKNKFNYASITVAFLSIITLISNNFVFIMKNRVSKMVATGGFKCTAVYYVQYFRMGRLKALSTAYCSFNVCDRDIFCIHAYSVFKKYT